MLVRGLEHLPCEEAEKVGAVRPGGRRLSGDFRRTFQYLKALQGAGEGLFVWNCSDRTRSNRSKLKEGKCI